MASTKISALSAATTLTGTEVIPVVQGGVTKKVTTDQFLIKDASGNVGLGVTPSAWGASQKAIQIGMGGAFVGAASAPTAQVAANTYYSDAYRYISTEAASRYQQYQGVHSWYTAPSGTAGNAISFGSPKMTLTVAGKLGVGTATPNETVQVGGTIGSIAAPGSNGLVVGDYDADAGTFAIQAISGRSLRIFDSYAGVERARIDASGNLGLGVTPSAWSDLSGGKAIQLLSGGLYSFSNFATGLSENSYYANGDKYIVSGVAAAKYLQNAGTHTWATAPSGTAGNPISFTQAMTLDVSGNLGVGTVSPTFKLDVAGDIGNGIRYTSTAAVGTAMGDANSKGFIGTTTNHALALWTNGTTKATLDASGNLDLNANEAYLNFRSTYSVGDSIRARVRTVGAGGGSGYGGDFCVSTKTPTNTWNTDAFVVNSAGSVGIGTASPGSKLDVRGQIEAGNGTIRGGISYSTRVELGALSNHDLGFITNSMTQAVLTTSGNLGLGVTPSAWGSAYKAMQIGQSALMSRSGGSDLYLLSNNYFDGTNFRYINSTLAARYTQDSGQHQWFTAPSGTAGNPISFTQAMTLDASGNLLVGTTTTDYTTHGLKYRADLGTLLVTSTDSESFFAHRIGSTGTLVNLYCTGNAVGSISSNGTTVAYNTSSDARLKENISNADNGSALIDGLQVRQFDWKADGSHQRFGFVAQELDAVYPEAVSKPADPDEMMGVDYSKLVPLLVQEIQSLRARVAALETV